MEMATDPIVTWREEDGIEEIESWDLGQVKAGTKSKEKTFTLWNNYNGEHDVSTMQDVSISVVNAGSDKHDDFLTNKWTYIRDDHEENGEFKQINNSISITVGGKDVDQPGSIEGTANDGNVKTNAKNFAKFTAFMLPDVKTTISGERKFKLVANYYYV